MINMYNNCLKYVVECKYATQSFFSIRKLCHLSNLKTKLKVILLNHLTENNKVRVNL